MASLHTHHGIARTVDGEETVLSDTLELQDSKTLRRIAKGALRVDGEESSGGEVRSCGARRAWILKSALDM